MLNKDSATETLARQICMSRELDGKPIPAGTYVAIAEGRVIGLGHSFDEADAHLAAARVEPGQGMICEVGDLETDVIRLESAPWT